METTIRGQESKNPSPISSPHSNGSNKNGVQTHSPPLTPIPICRSDTNPYPTTFVQADTSTFKQVVQMLTGSTETAKHASTTSSPSPSPRTHQDPNPTTTATSRNYTIPPIKTAPKRQQQQPSFKLYERRNNSNLKNSLMIDTLLPGFANVNNNSFSPRNKAAEILSPSLLKFPKLTLSPVTPLNEDPFNKTSPSLGNSSSSSSEEERAIAEKGFYLHPSPMSTPRGAEPPQLLPLFPLTSPKVSGSSSA